MPALPASDATTYALHGASFVSYANADAGLETLRAWRLDLAPHTPGTAHTVDREEVFLVLSGEVIMTINGHPTLMHTGDVSSVVGGDLLHVDNLSGAPAAMWTTTTRGLQATMADGQVISPPWVH